MKNIFNGPKILMVKSSEQFNFYAHNGYIYLIKNKVTTVNTVK